MPDQLNTVLLAAVAAAMFLAPGWLIARVSGRRGTNAVLWASPLSAMILITVAYIGAWTPILYTRRTIAAGFAAALLAAFLWAALTRPRKNRSDNDATPHASRAVRARDLGAGWGWLAVLGTFVTALVVMWQAWAGDLEISSQSYDTLQNMSSVRHVMETGIADPLHLTGFVGGAERLGYYPSAFHALAAFLAVFLKTDAVVGGNLAGLVVIGLLWPSAVMIATRALVGTGKIPLIASAAVCLGFWGMPWAPMGWGTLFATTMGSCFAPLALVGAARLLDLTLPPSGPKWRALLVGLVGAAFTAAGHPRSLVIITVAAVPVWIFFLIRGVVRSVRARKYVGVPFYLGIGAASWWGVNWLLTFRGMEHKVVTIKWPVHQTLGEAAWHAVTNQPILGIEGQYVVAALAVAGAIIAVITRRLAWLTLSYAILIFLTARAASTQEGVLDVIARYWYNDQYRVVTILPVVGVPLCALAITKLTAWIGRLGPLARWRSSPRRSAQVLGALGATVLLGAGLATSVPASKDYLSQNFHAGAVSATSLVSPEEVDFFKQIGDIATDGTAILNNPLDGSSLIYAYTGREVVFYTPFTSSTARGMRLRTQLLDLTDRQHVCANFTRDGIGWIVNLGPTYSNEIIKPTPQPQMQIPPGYWLTTEVARSGEAALHKVTACGPILPGGTG